jgi:L-alanine-DL-glutamate epimerase-like enolase superfamily enzyme
MYPVEPWEYGSAPIRPDGSGLVRAPEAPGSGLELDWERLRSLTVGEVALRV